MGLQKTISDIAGTTVGHYTVAVGERQTGFTLLMPAQDNLFEAPLVAAVHVINGFGKSVGLMQVEELGQLETPILLTNTLQVGLGADALVQFCLEHYGPGIQSINPVVMECNDSYLNAIQQRNLGYEALRQAFETAAADFAQGAVGAGRGMSCFQLKGGIGSASRQVQHEGEGFTLGALVLTNFGRKADFTMLKGDETDTENVDDKGSCIIILAMDAPLDSRQLKRVAKRAEVGLARLGGHIGHGSGEVVLAYTTANRLSRESVAVDTIKRFPEHRLDLFFRAAIDAVEEAVLNSMRHAETVAGYEGHVRERWAE